MPDTIDSLQIEINAKATKANDAIDRLVVKLDRLTTSLSRINGTNLNGLANGVQRLGTAMQTMNTIKTADFTRLATNLTRLGSVNTSALNNAASSMSHLTRAFNSLGTVSANAQSISQLVNSMSRLGGANIQRAITNIPQLATAMSGLMATLSRAPRVNQNIIQMTNALANLASQGSKVGTASNSIVAGFSKTEKSARKSSKGFKGLASAIGKFYATYFMAIRGLKGLWKSVESTADYIEAYNYFNVSLGKIGADWSHQFEKYGYDNAESYAESFNTRLTESLKKLSGVQISVGANGKGLLTETGMKNLGLNIQEITQYASQLASVTNSVGQTGEVSLAASSAFTKLAGDISSLFNMDYSAVAKNLQSGLIGQSRALYKFGLDITAATLQTYAYNLGLSKSVSEMTQAEKMQLRMIAILDQSKVSWGDLANTINSPSNMIRQFKNNLKETGLVLGQLFIPTLQKVLPLINGASIAFKRLLTDIAGFLNINIDLDSFGQGYTDMEDDVDGITDSYDDATKAAEEWKNQLLGFDEVNKLTENASADNTGLEDSTIDLTDNIIAASSEYEKVWKKAYEQMENSANVVADKIEKAFEPLKNIGKLILKGDLYEAGTSLAELLNDGIIDYDWGKVGSWVGNRITATIDFVAGFTNNLDWKGLAKNLTSFVNSAIKNINVSSLADAINGLLNGIWDFAVTALETLDWGQLAKKIGQLLGELDWGVIAKIGFTVGTVKLAGKFIGMFGASIKTGFTSVFSGLAKESTIISSLSTAGSAFGETLANALTSPLMLIPAVAGLIVSNVSQSYAETAKNFEKARGKVDEETQKIVDNATTVINKAKEVADSIYAGFEGSTGEATGIETIAKKYFELASKIGKTKEEMELLEGYKQALITEGGEKFKGIIDDTTLSYEEQKKKIQELIDEMKNKARIEAASGYIADISKEMLPVQSTVDELADQTEDARKEAIKYKNELVKGQNELEKYIEDNFTFFNEKEGMWKDVYDENGVLIQDAYETGKKYWEMYAKYANVTFSDSLPEMLRASDEELASMMNNQENINYKANEATKNYDALNEKYKESKKTLEDLSTQMDYYVGISSGAISTQTSLYEYQKQVAEAEKKAAEEAKVAMNYAKSAADETKSTIDGKFKPEDFTQLGANATSGIALGMSSKRQDILNITNQLGSDIRGEFGASNYTDSGKNVTSGITTGMNDAGQKTALRTTSDSIRGLIERSFNNSSNFVTFGKNILEGLRNGLSNSSTISSITSKVTGIANSIKNTFTGLLGIHSPSTVFEEYGEFTFEGYNIGAEDMFSDTLAMFKKFGSNIGKYAVADIPDLTYNAPSISSTYDTNYVSRIDITNQEEIALLRQQNQLLQALLQKENAVISPDADGIFKIVQNKANIYTTQTGNPAFLI